MNAVLEQRGLPEARARWQPWLLLALGFAALYVPTYVSLARTLWRDDAYAHGPITLGAFAWLAWRERAALLAPAGRPAIGLGAASLALGLLLYVGGRALALTPIEVASHIPVLAGLVLLIGGFPALRRYAFALGFLLFLIPLPGFILDAATTPLKSVVSVAVEALLRVAGYAVERNGVVLSLGDNQMLVADACSGLNSIFSLFALGLLYTHLTGPKSRIRTATLLAAVVPIAIAANILRVTALVLITVHFGEEAAQGFLHGVAGMLVFIAALAMLVGIDQLFRGQTTCPTGKNVGDTMAASTRPSPRGKWLVPGLAALAMAGAAVATPVIKPVPAHLPIDLERALPTSFADWRVDPDTESVAPTPDVQSKLDLIYNQIVSRTYVNAAGERMMLTVAYGGDQSDALKAHRQEACYAAQGFEIHDLQHGTASAAGRMIPVTRMVAVRGERVEPVTYWFTMGDRVVLGRAERLHVQVASGLRGRVPDGMLVRVSSLSEDAPRAFAAQQAFLAAIFTPMPEGQAARFVGRRGS
jgi:exosortase B